MMRKTLKASFWLGGLGLAYDYSTEEKLVFRNIRTIRCGINILYQYKWRFNADNANDVHDAVAKDIYETCLLNDGLYVKFGQGVAAMEHLLPPPYLKWMSLLQDKAQQVPYKRVREIIKQETGKELEETFSEFNPEAVASASIAQVHKAKLISGETVAVKVQKPNIQKQFRCDMNMHYVLLLVLEYAFDLPLMQFQKSIDDNLSKEIDFRIEEQNGDLARRALKATNRSDVYIPKYYPNLVSKSLLISEWIDGIKITDMETLKKEGYNTKALMETVISAFAEQIFITGFVHCDPHPGNIFVRKYKGQPQIVLLDFGLCLRIDNQFRQDYASFWKYMFLQDKDNILKIIKKWGIYNEEMFASMQLMKPYSLSKPVHAHKLTAEEVMAQQLRMKSEITKMMKQTQDYPQDLLFVNRNMNLVRSVNKSCGSQVNRINIMARFAQQGSLIDADLLSANIKYKKQQGSSLYFELRLMISSIVYTVVNYFLRFRGTSLEDVIEEHQKVAMQQMYTGYAMKVPDHKTFDA